MRAKLAALLATSLLFAGPALAAPEDDVHEAADVVTRVEFLDSVLGDLGVELRDLDSGPADARGYRSFPGEGGLEFRAPGGAFQALTGGSVRHAGGFVLERAGRQVDLRAFELRPGVRPHTVDLFDAGGSAALFADLIHTYLDIEAGTLNLRNADLKLSAGAAAALGEPRMTGLVIGRFALDSSFAPFRAALPEGLCTTPNYTLPKDVALIDIPNTQQMYRTGDLLVVAPSARLKNVGPGDVPWCEAFYPLEECENVDQHPFLVWGLYRAVDGGIEQIGRSSVKHAFYTINQACPPCLGGNVLWEDCEDVYSSSNNDLLDYLAPRRELEAHTGDWNKCNGYFDPDCDGEREHPTPQEAQQERLLNRLVVDVDELATAGAEYFVESWYVVKGDIDIFNTMGWRQAAPSPIPDSSLWLFSLTSAFANGPVIDAWVAPERGGVADRARLDTGVGHVTVATRVEDLGGGSYRYRYALQNHDYDATVASFEVPVPLGATASDLAFTDADSDGANDWFTAVAPGAVRFTAPPNNRLDWGTLYSFAVTVDHAPEASRVTLANPGGQRLAAELLAPAAVIFASGFESGGTDGWGEIAPPPAAREDPR